MCLCCLLYNIIGGYRKIFDITFGFLYEAIAIFSGVLSFGIQTSLIQVFAHTSSMIRIKMRLPRFHSGRQMYRKPSLAWMSTYLAGSSKVGGPSPLPELPLKVRLGSRRPEGIHISTSGVGQSLHRRSNRAAVISVRSESHERCHRMVGRWREDYLAATSHILPLALRHNHHQRPPWAV